MIGTIEPIVELSGVLSGVPTLSGTISAVMELSGTLSTVIDRNIYDGAYTFTPSAQEQTIVIENMIASSNITINAIPSNYGLITWNGSTLTVS